MTKMVKENKRALRYRLVIHKRDALKELKYCSKADPENCASCRIVKYLRRLIKSVKVSDFAE